MLAGISIRSSSRLCSGVVPLRSSGKTLPNRHNQRPSLRPYAANSESKSPKPSYYRQYCSKKESSPSTPSSPTSHSGIEPNMTTVPKAMRNMSNPVSPQVDLGKIQIGPDGVVVPPTRSRSTASAQFTARKAQTSQEDLLKKMYEIDKKVRSTREEAEVAKPSTTPKATYKHPELVIYAHYPRKWVHTLNGVACLGSFPVHIWGFYLLPPHLVAPLFAGSIIWAWWHNRVMKSTLTKVVMLPGHKTVEIHALNFLGGATQRTVNIHSLTTVLGRPSSKLQMTREQAESSIGASMATTEVHYLDVDERLANAKSDEDVQAFKTGNDTVFRTRYVVDHTLATTFRHNEFLKFTGAPTIDHSQLAAKNMFE